MTAHDDEPWRDAIDDLETQMIACQTTEKGLNTAIAAIALALIDADVIERGRLLDIIESLRAWLHADAVIDNIGDVQDAEVPLDNLAAWIGGSEWKKGKVLDQLHLIENAEVLRLHLRKTK